MRIFQVINVRWFNATSWYALYLSKLLQDAGHEVLVITVPDTETEEKAIAMGLKVETIDLNSTRPLKLIKACAKVLSLVRLHNPHIVNCHRGEAFFWWGILRKLRLGYKLIRTRGDQRLPRNDFINRHLHSDIADGVVVTNKRMAEHFLKKMRLAENRLWLIHGGVDTDRFKFDPEGRNKIREKFGFSPDDTVVGMLGRFDRVKGQRELIEAIAETRMKIKDKSIKLFLIGFPTATSKHEVDTWLSDNNLTGITAISGKCEDVTACISAIDIGVIASLWSETIARAALEIMACQRPLISTTVGVMPDLLPQEALVPPEDVTQLSLKLTEVISNPDLRQKLIEEHALTMSQLSGEDFLKRTLTLYQGVLD
ncbi:glycosyltransferase family 4 protein [Maridesulfovibrio hydrothermalis]|uniref:Glycosyl transferase group 1 n=1 Tax=Maridesulfovibrio hydrothermalis AM13 = DSM 14728 TaxID=1121451 RepID=L0RHE1_9BACT|nr:glycosyltransferase family 4 protein [Maridesulfovibrio hydrothermalis]CCO24981.1 Glycosyl transferase group 1 [Maridesulfovibrio hydrothermalis AM13 = DSM 14728]